MNCLFDNGSECGALINKKCDKCKFKKTPEEFKRGLIRAEESLLKRGLEPVKKKIDGILIMSVRPISRWEYDD